MMKSSESSIKDVGNDPTFQQKTISTGKGSADTTTDLDSSSNISPRNEDDHLSSARELLSREIITEREFEIIEPQLKFREELENEQLNHLKESQLSDKSRSSNSQDKSWWIGKYVGRPSPSLRDSLNAQSQSEKGTLGLEDDSSLVLDEKESMMSKILGGIRSIMIARGISGDIEFRRLSGIFNSVCFCTVLPEELDLCLNPSLGLQTNEKEEDMSGVSGPALKVYNCTTALLVSMENRAMSGYRSCSFASNVRIGRGVTIGVSDPFVGLIAFSYILNIVAPVKDLIAAYGRRKAREAARKEERSRKAARSQREDKDADKGIKNDDVTEKKTEVEIIEK